MSDHCPQCGCVLPEDEKVRIMEDTVLALSNEIARKQAQIKRMQTERSKRRPPEYDDAMEVAEYWREHLMPRAKELNGPRIQITIERLQHGYEKYDLLRSLDGYAIKPNVSSRGRCRVSEGGRRQVELSLLMRDAEHVDRGIDIWESEMAHDQAVLNGGGSRYVAALCGCGHPLVSHQLFYLTGSTACAERDCDCREFDTLPAEIEKWHAQRGTPSDKPIDQEAVTELVQTWKAPPQQKLL